jgi:hypothetical protein
MGKKSGKGNGPEVKKLTATVEKLQARLKKAEAATDKWKAKSKLLEAEASKRLKQVKQLRKVRLRPSDAASQPQPVATDEPPTAAPPTAAPPTAAPVPAASSATSSATSSAASGPDDSWTVVRLRASAREAGVVGASRMSKAALLEALTKG